MMAGPMDLPEYKMTGIKIIHLQIAKSEAGCPNVGYILNVRAVGRGGVYGLSREAGAANPRKGKGLPEEQGFELRSSSQCS